MTRRIVYAVGLVLTLACTAMTIASIAMPRWVSYSPVSCSRSSSSHFTNNVCQNGEREYSYGLHSRCSNKTGHCVPFPRTSDCDKDASFCNMWRTVGFLMSFGVVVELCTLVSFVVIVAGGVQRRVQGWGVVVGVLLFSAFIQCAGMAIVVSQMSVLHRTCLLTVPVLRLRPRCAIFLWLPPGLIVVHVHRVLDTARCHSPGHYSFGILPAYRG